MRLTLTLTFCFSGKIIWQQRNRVMPGGSEKTSWDLEFCALKMPTVSFGNKWTEKMWTLHSWGIIQLLNRDKNPMETKIMNVLFLTERDWTSMKVLWRTVPSQATPSPGLQCEERQGLFSTDYFRYIIYRFYIFYFPYCKLYVYQRIVRIVSILRTLCKSLVIPERHHSPWYGLIM